MNKQHVVFIAAILAIALVVGGLVYKQESILKNGDTVILATRPVDPRDLFRGEYVILRYEIENNESLVAVSRGMQNGASIYALLSVGSGGIAAISEVKESAPESYDDLWIKGEVSNGQARFPSIEQYYVPEGAGRPIEDLRSELHVEVVLKDGAARVVNLLDASLNVIDVTSYLNK